MILERVDQRRDGFVEVLLRVEDDERSSLNELRILANEGSPELWKLPLVCNNEEQAQRLRFAQEAALEYHCTILDADASPAQQEAQDQEYAVANAVNSDEYFKSYDQVEVQRLMLADEPRMAAYTRALQTSSLEKKIVMDVGAGSGYLAIVAARCGAKVVHGVEAAPTLGHLLPQIMARNNVSDIVKVHAVDVEKLEYLTGEGSVQDKVDVIVSEWMGFYLLHESMLSSVIHARRRWLRSGGVMIPSHARLYLALVSMKDLYRRRVDFLRDVHGVDMCPLIPAAQRALIERPVIETVPAHAMMSEALIFAELDLALAEESDIVHLQRKLEFDVTRDGTVHGLCCFFDVQLSSSVVLSTAPHEHETHWKQSLFLFGDEYHVERGASVRCHVQMKQSESNKRHYDIDIATSLI